jgi:hypothetical protein
MHRAVARRSGDPSQRPDEHACTHPQTRPTPSRCLDQVRLPQVRRRNRRHVQPGREETRQRAPSPTSTPVWPGGPYFARGKIVSLGRAEVQPIRARGRLAISLRRAGDPRRCGDRRKSAESYPHQQRQAFPRDRSEPDPGWLRPVLRIHVVHATPVDVCWNPGSPIMLRPPRSPWLMSSRASIAS